MLYQIKKKSQQGAALIFIAIILALTITAYAIKSYNSVELQSQAELATGRALSEAKTAILGWSVTRNNPGQLPCPEDITKIGELTEGVEQGSCTLPAIGRLPWKTLGIGDIRDGHGDKLWYAISNGFRIKPINSSTLAQLSVDGNSNAAVAIVFSSGTPINGQSRAVVTSTSPPDVSQYLELDNNNGDANFVTTGAENLFNDRLLTISHAELFGLVSKRILRTIRGDTTEGLIHFYNTQTHYPYADTNNDGVANDTELIGNPSYQAGTDSITFVVSTKKMLLDNEWMPLITYTVDSTQQKVALSLNGYNIGVEP